MAPLLADRFPQWKIGPHSYGDPAVYDYGNSELSIGDYCSISTDVTIFLGGEHRTDWVTTYPFSILWPAGESIVGHPASKGHVTIGNDVWIGFGAIILSGVTIGDGAVIGAGSVVTSDIPAYAIAAGNPCTVIRMRFSSDQVEALRHLSWWTWSEERIASALPLLLSGDIQSLLDTPPQCANGSQKGPDAKVEP